MRSCTIPECDGVHWARSWCRRHYQRWLTHGDPLTVRPHTETPLVCVCPIPQPTPSDMCARCCRVIAALVWERRALRAGVGDVA